MDGLPPPPPPPVYSPSGPGSPVGLAPSPSPQRPVGRPSGDPDRDDERNQQKVSIGKFVSLLPKDATDHRVAIYKLKGSRGQRHDNRPLLRILMSELEEAQQQGNEPQDFIISTLTDRFGERPMRVLCVPQDNHGHKVNKLAAWEMHINMEDDDVDDEEDGQFDEGFDLDDVYGALPPGMQGSQFGPNFGHPAPPPAPPGDGGTVLREAKSMIASQREAEQSSTALLIAMMQQQAQQQAQSANMMMQMMQTMSAERERRAEEQRKEEQRLADERRRDDDRRMDDRRREEERRAESRLQLLATLTPALLPLIQRVMEGKEDKITPLLLTKFLDGDKDRSSAGEMIALMSEASKQQVMSQGEMMRNTMAQQSEMSKSMIAHVLQMAQDSVAAQRKLEENKEGGPMDTFASLLSAIGPLLQSASAGSQGAPQQMPPPQAQPPPRQHLPPPPPREAQPPPRSADPTRETHPEFTDEQWIQGSLGTLAALQQGRLPAAQRGQALAWMIRVLPPRLQNAIADRDDDTIQEITAPILFADQGLMEWISQEPAQQFLRGAVDEMGTMLRESRASAGRSPAKASKIPPPPVEDTTVEDMGLEREESLDYPPPSLAEHDAAFPQQPQEPQEPIEVTSDADATE